MYQLDKVKSTIFKCFAVYKRYQVLILNILSFVLLAIFFILMYSLFQVNLPTRFFSLYYNFWQNWNLIGDISSLIKIGLFGFSVFLVNNLIIFSLEEERIRKITAYFTFLIVLTLIFTEIYLYFLQFKF